MPGLHIHRSNRLESLAAGLAGLLKTPLKSILQPEIIVVQSVGMRRWLALELANALGITMNVQFPFPATFAHDVFRSAFPEVQKTLAFSRELMTWRTMSALPELLDLEDSPVIARYLENDATGLKRFQLSEQIANVFDRYLLHRTEKLVEWQQADSVTSWQARLWKILATGHAETNPPILLKRFIDRVASGQRQLPQLPERVSVFGVSNLSPFYIHLLGGIADCIDVHLYLFEPTDQYWGDIQTQREQDQVLRRQQNKDLTPAELHLDSGNGLLASMGKPARQFARAVQLLDPSSFDENFHSPAQSSLLEAIQGDIFNLTDRRLEKLPKGAISADDFSVQVHCCHGPMREVEILHDHLLDLLERLPGLSPKDILVMMPDVEKYAPFVEAVFGAPESEVVRIPFTIADRALRIEAPIAEGLSAILALHGSRFEASVVLALLEFEPIRAKFGLIEADLESIREWLLASAVRWGVDGEHRAEFGVPAFEQNSWRQGIDRLLLGYALRGDGHQVFEGLLPVPDVEGSRAAILGGFVEFAEQLFSAVRDLSAARTLEKWSATLGDLLTKFFHQDDASAEEFNRLRGVFSTLAQLETTQQVEVSFQVLSEQLEHMLADNDSGFGFLAGHTTFCSLRPMRSIPFRVICVLGLNDTDFPRSDAPLAFDLTVQEANPGDRSRRDDDRQLFLETLLSARDALYLSYSGSSLREDSERPPSVVVSELLDYIESNYTAAPGPSIRENILRRHRLQPFSDAYFAGDARMFSYSFENCRAGTARSERSRTRSPFVDGPFTAGADGKKNLSLENLITFLRDPSRSFVRDRLQLRLPRDAEPLENSEPMEIGPLERTRLVAEILEMSAEGVPPETIREIHRASGRLPAGWQGDMSHRALARSAGKLLNAMRGFQDAPPLPPLEIDLVLAEWRLNGQITAIRPCGALQYRGSSIKPRDLLKAWVSHLALCSSNQAGYPDVTHLYGINNADAQHVTFGPVENPEAILLELVGLYEDSLTGPIPLYPNTSWAYAQSIANGDDPDAIRKSLQEATRTWEGTTGNNGLPGEREDEAVRLCCRGQDNPLNDRWQEVSRIVFLPIIRAMAESEEA